MDSIFDRKYLRENKVETEERKFIILGQITMNGENVRNIKIYKNI